MILWSIGEILGAVLLTGSLFYDTISSANPKLIVIEQQCINQNDEQVTDYTLKRD
jgi:hypothetical protein